MGKWSVSSSGHYTYSPYLSGTDDPNKPPPGTTSTAGPAYSSPINSAIPLDTFNVSSPTQGGATQQIVDWTKLGTQSPYSGFDPSKPLTGSQNMGLGGALGGSQGSSTPPPPPPPGGLGSALGDLPPGFDIRAGSQDPAINRQVYGDNYFPGGLPGFENITNVEQFNALNPGQQGSYREALWLYNRRKQGLGRQPGDPLPPLPGDPVGQPGYKPPVPGGGGTPPPGGSTPPPGGSVGPSGPGSPPPAGPPTRGPELDDPRSYFDDNLRFPKQSITPEDVMLDPGYKWQKEQLDRMLEDRFAAKGRVGSTDYFNAGRAQDLDLVSREYNRINNQQWDRGMEMNRLLYDRRVQENYTQYEREFRENERLYGRKMAEDILAYERAFREDAREYDRYRYLVELGFNATNASSGT